MPATATEGVLDIYRLATENDPGLKAADASRLAARETLPQARALLLPAVNLGADATRTWLNVHDGPDSSFNSTGYTLSLSQPLYHRDYFVQLRQADSQVQQAETTYAAAAQSVITQVAEAYFNVLAAVDNLGFARAEKEAIGRQLEQTKQRFEVGLIAITDVHEAQARHDLAAAQEIAAINQVDLSREALRELTGVLHDDIAPLGEKLPLVKPEPADLEQWVRAAEQNNLQLIAAQQGLAIAREEIKRQESGHYPTLDLVGTHAYSNAGGGLTGKREFDNTAIGVQFNLPLYLGGAVSSRTRQAQHQYQAASDNLEAQRRSTSRTTRDAYLSVIAGISQVNALNQAVISNQSALEATEAGFEVGTRTIVDVLNAQQDLFGAQRDYSRARYDYIVNSLRLKQAAGSLSEEDLAQVDTWLTKTSKPAQ